MRDDSKLLDVENSTEAPDLAAGDFSPWLRRTRSAQLKKSGADVPCDDCTACCTSSYFIHIEPDETQTLSRIDEKLLFPAPSLPDGHMLMGFDENGHCPMLQDGHCSIYEDRPQTCRNYDCRVFVAAGIAAGGDDKVRITQRTRRWKFSDSDEHDRAQRSAVRAAAHFLRERAESFPAGFLPSNPTQLAILAIKVYDVFIEFDQTETRDGTGRGAPDLEVVEAVVEASQRFESGNETNAADRGRHSS